MNSRSRNLWSSYLHSGTDTGGFPAPADGIVERVPNFPQPFPRQELPAGQFSLRKGPQNLGGYRVSSSGECTESRWGMPQSPILVQVHSAIISFSHFNPVVLFSTKNPANHVFAHNFLWASELATRYLGISRLHNKMKFLCYKMHK